jgi:hypothetical protein
VWAPRELYWQDLPFPLSQIIPLSTIARLREHKRLYGPVGAGVKFSCALRTAVLFRWEYQMEKLGVFKRYSDGELVFVSWAETLEDSKTQIQELVKSDGQFAYFVHDFRSHAEVWFWSPADDAAA